MMSFPHLTDEGTGLSVLERQALGHRAVQGQSHDESTSVCAF